MTGFNEVNQITRIPLQDWSVLMKRTILIVLSLLLAACGIALLYSCGGSGSNAGTTYYADADGDGFGNASSFQVLDSPQAGWILDSTDCEDDAAFGFSINPSASEECDDWIDNDCNDLMDCYDVGSCAGTTACLGCNDTDTDGYYEAALNCPGGNDCADADSTVNPGVDLDGDGYHACEDCDDGEPLAGRERSRCATASMMTATGLSMRGSILTRTATLPAAAIVMMRIPKSMPEQ